MPDWVLISALARRGRGMCLGRTPRVNDQREGLPIAPRPDATRSSRAFYLVQSTRATTVGTERVCADRASTAQKFAITDTLNVRGSTGWKWTSLTPAASLRSRDW